MSIPPSTVADTERSWMPRFSHQHVLHRRGALVLGGEDLGMIRVEREPFFVLLLLAEAVEALDRRMAMSAVHPLAACPPHELRGFRRTAERLPRAKQRLDVHAIINLGVFAGVGHGFLLRASHCENRKHSLVSAARPNARIS
jgi:hypothetical protein